MARMGKGHMCLLFSVMFLILVSMGLIVTSITTDFWYEVKAPSNATGEVLRNYSYTIGMWRRCYKHGIPAGVPAENRAGSCVYTYKDLVKRAEDKMPSDDYKYLSLERSWVALMITAGGVQLFTVIALIMGLWPGDCKAMKRSTLYLIAALMCLFASMAAIASGICFIALRDIDKTSGNKYASGVSTRYDWSFMIGWVGTGFCMIEGFIFLALLRMDYEDVSESGRYQTM